MATHPFFFQAEDGIRDYKVTGVQTCSLPIYYQSCRRACSTARSAAGDHRIVASGGQRKIGEEHLTTGRICQKIGVLKPLVGEWRNTRNNTRKQEAVTRISCA